MRSNVNTSGRNKRWSLMVFVSILPMAIISTIAWLHAADETIQARQTSGAAEQIRLRKNESEEKGRAKGERIFDSPEVL